MAFVCRDRETGVFSMYIYTFRYMYYITMCILCLLEDVNPKVPAVV